MKTEKLAKKFELYLKLNGGLGKQDITIQDCRKCLLNGVCKPDSVRRSFIKVEQEKIEGANKWKQKFIIIGYGLDFGIPGCVEDNAGNITFNILKPCIEWLDPNPRIFEK